MQAERAEEQQDADVGAGNGGADHRRALLVVAGIAAAVLLVSSAGLVVVGDLRSEARSAVALLLMAGLAYGVSCAALARAWAGLDSATRRRTLVAIAVVAVAMRLLLLAVPPSLSDDIYRYRWDGKVQAAGINPYVEPPAAPALAELRDAYWNRINYPRIRTIYPPLTQRLFALTYALDDSLLAFRAAALLGDLIAIGLLALCLRTWKRPAWMLALYALHPLPAVEFASSGHFDAWAIGALLAALLAHSRRAPTLAAACLAAGVLLKTWPLVFVPLIARRWSWRQGAAFAAVLVAGYLPYLNAGAAMAQPWLDYAGRWRFNDGVFWVLASVTGSIDAAKAIAAGIGGSLFLWLWRRDADPIAGGYWLLLAFILLMPTVHPWYMLWALPLAAAAGDRGWATLCALAPLAYTILIGAGNDSNAWSESTWPRFAQYVPALLAWGWQTRASGAPTPLPSAGSGGLDGARVDGG